MKYQLFTRIALKMDLPQHGLRSGDVATIVGHHAGGPGQEPGYTLECLTQSVKALQSSRCASPRLSR